MRRATTPTHNFTFPEDIPVDSLTEVLVTYSQCKKTVLEKRLSDLEISTESNSFSCTLTQAETKKFAPGEALVQIRAKGENGKVLASQMIWVDVKPVLNSEEM